MKKLLFILSILIGFNFISMANFIPLEQCYNGGHMPVGQCPAPPAPRYYGGISIDPATRKYGATWNYSNGNEAQNRALELCRKNSGSNRCISHWASYYYTAVAISSDDKVTEFASSDSYGTAWDNALKACKNAGGYDCEVVLMGSNSSEPDEKRWGSLSYNVKTGAMGISWSHYTRREAVAGSEKACGSAECASLGFQSKYAAMAISPDSRLIVGTSGKNMKDAEKDAIKKCKKNYKVKTCEITVKGMAEREYK